MSNDICQIGYMTYILIFAETVSETKKEEPRGSPFSDSNSYFRPQSSDRLGTGLTVLAADQR